MARRGLAVTATDASSEMLELAREKARRAGVADRIELVPLDLETVDRHTEPPGTRRRFDGAVSNFGVLNCLPERHRLAAGLGRWIRPGGTLAVVVMGPFCPWEIVAFLLRGRPREAFRRWRQGAPAPVGGGAATRVWYPSPGWLQAELGDYFQRRELRGIGVLLPPSDLASLVERRPELWDRLEVWEERIAGWWPASRANDHYLMVLERRPPEL